jgi:hypothetical protein
MNHHKVARQAAGGIIMLTFAVDPVPLLHCVLPTGNTMKQLESVRSRLRQLPYRNLLELMRRELIAANQFQQDQSAIQSANIVALYAVLYNPCFGSEIRSLLNEVRRNRHNLGLVVTCVGNKIALGVSAGIANIAMGMIGKTQEQAKFQVMGTKHTGTATWRTRVDPEMTKEYGKLELHIAVF